ncbi:hypothetical protein WMY93_033203 [Mugilogobius chulae]|uniref:C1q domain-containing protein n=1 Tax=Mugilogobius chulae TaxID=88201 RepID=A0AAW0MHL0_9GOBI
MERVSVLCVLLLLLCSPSGAELQDNEISEQRQAGPESVNVPEQPQPYPSNLDAVLRDMSAALAEHRVRIQQLQDVNQEQAAKLRELEFKTRDMDSQQQALGFASYNKSLKIGQVAFSASLVASGEQHLGPYNTHTTLFFKHVVTNIGNAYSPNTGVFTAPVRGAYHFEIYVHGLPHFSHPSAAVLVKNGEHIFMAYEHQSFGSATSANGVTLLLETGDVVFVRQWQNSRIYDNYNHHTTFSGHLLFPM